MFPFSQDWEKGLGDEGIFGCYLFPLHHHRLGPNRFHLRIEGRQIAFEHGVELRQLLVNSPREVIVDVVGLLGWLAFDCADHRDQGGQLGVDQDREVERVLSRFGAPLDQDILDLA